MESTGNLSKLEAVDGKGGYAGNIEPDPEQASIDKPLHDHLTDA
jgi:hypothetical protein